MPSKVLYCTCCNAFPRALHDSLARAGCASSTCSPFQASPDDQGQDCRPWPALPSIPTQSCEEATSGGQARPGQARQGQQGQVTSQRRCNRSRKRGLDLNGHPRRFIAAERGEQITKKFRKTHKMTSLATPPAENHACHEPELIAADFGTSRRPGLALYSCQKVAG